VSISYADCNGVIPSEVYRKVRDRGHAAARYAILQDLNPDLQLRAFTFNTGPLFRQCIRL
jgi:hypothetical protein